MSRSSFCVPSGDARGQGRAGAIRLPRRPAARAWPAGALIALAAPLWALAAAVRAEPMVPQITASEIEIPAKPAGPTDINQAVAAFVEGCIAHRGAFQPVIDWGVSNGFEPLSADDPEQAGYLSGREGTALFTLAPGRIVLAATQDGQCMVWAEGAHGPRLQVALQKAFGPLGRDGATLRKTQDRVVSRSGVWRKLQQWRYRPAGSEADFRVAAVTMVNTRLGTQALSLAPWPPGEDAADGGVATR